MTRIMGDTNGKLCFVLNMAPHYRKGIFSLLDASAPCKWIFGENKSDIPSMDTSQLADCIVSPVKKAPANFKRLPGVWRKVLRDKEISHVVTTGDIKFVPSWGLLLFNRLKPGRHRKKIYLWSHGWTGPQSPLLSSGIGARIKRFVYKLYFNLADGTFMYGDLSRRLAIEEGCKAEKLSVIHNSLNYSAHHTILASLGYDNIYDRLMPAHQPVIIFIGRLTAVKRLDLLLEASAIMHERGVAHNVIVVGTGPEEKHLHDKAEKLGIDSQVKWYGECYDEAETARLLYDADVCVSPGNVGLTAIHSLTYGTPVITNDDFLIQMPEYEAIAEGKSGAFFKADDSESLASAITGWLAAHPDRMVVRQACMDSIRKGWIPEYQLKVLASKIPMIRVKP